ncbi:MAG: glycoside hydrolase family 172 protein [Promethearchaeota archaeon]
MEFGISSLENLAKIRKNVKRKRISSYDKTGANVDCVLIKEKEKYEICNIQGAGIIKHIWMTLASNAPYYLRKIVLRMWWDDEKDPSVEVPIGDFFGVGHGRTVNFWSLPLAMGPEDGKGFNCFFPMPFSSGARIEVENESETDLILYFYIDYEEHPKLPENYGRFHAAWRRENPCKGNEYRPKKKAEVFIRKNKTHENDYLILEAEGEGHYVGCHLDIFNLMTTENKSDKDRFWPGEGDDYIEIDDGEIIIYGTGTEDYFCTSWCPTQFYCSPYFGIPLPGGENWSGHISYYRFHIEDPIYFHKNIKVKIEHGHANQRSDDFSSTAYWYQDEPHKKFWDLLPVDQRIPREEPKQKN